MCNGVKSLCTHATHTYIHTYTQATHTHIHTRHTHTHATHTHIHASHTYTHATHTHIHTRHTYTHTHTPHIHTYTYIHTYIHATHKHIHTCHTYTHTTCQRRQNAEYQKQNKPRQLLQQPLNSFLPRTTWVSRYQKGKTSLGLNEARDDGGLWWQWHRLDHMQTICTSLETDNHTNTGCSSWRPTNSVKALKAEALKAVTYLLLKQHNGYFLLKKNSSVFYNGCVTYFKVPLSVDTASKYILSLAWPCARCISNAFTSTDLLTQMKQWVSLFFCRDQSLKPQSDTKALTGDHSMKSRLHNTAAAYCAQREVTRNTGLWPKVSNQIT